MMRIVAIVQARMTSTRLPGKVMADLSGRPLIARMLDRVQRARRLSDCIVATTVNASDAPVADLAQGRGVTVFRGSEHDVLDRFTAAARQARADAVVRLTADCPMIDPSVIDECIALFQTAGVDYASNVNRRTYPDGLDVEVFSMEALERANREAADQPRLREHVTMYMRGKFPELPQGNFSRADLTFQADFGHLRWTVDYPEDMDRLRMFFAELVEPFSWLDALSLATRKPWLLGSQA